MASERQPNPRTHYDKLWDAHVVATATGNQTLLYIDRHLAIAVDLELQCLSADSIGTIPFAIDQETRESLLNGCDETARIRDLYADAIVRFETRQRIALPWLWTADGALPRVTCAGKG